MCYPVVNDAGAQVYGAGCFILYGIDTFYDGSDPTAAWVIGGDGERHRGLLLKTNSRNILLGVLLVEK